jgi:hypothetical protein
LRGNKRRAGAQERVQTDVTPFCDVKDRVQGKIERWHQTLKNRILLENYYLPGQLEASIDKFVDHYIR